ncbi:hypothetical protein GMRT_15080 [Giardia muris]|uniref:Uncharacterized protein n=1 Tax=Giardia muris TaxID=5742 RepID=A0A4Z1SZ68_GIAMU|nr:hypothetical protein GMRT_15080 [Giardia muris]|eukprot:TNJ26953.1 hypothetical protein GMRT_15080 [Giardia muris]
MLPYTQRTPAQQLYWSLFDEGAALNTVETNIEEDALEKLLRQRTLAHELAHGDSLVIEYFSRPQIFIRLLDLSFGPGDGDSGNPCRREAAQLLCDMCKSPKLMTAYAGAPDVIDAFFRCLHRCLLPHVTTVEELEAYDFSTAPATPDPSCFGLLTVAHTFITALMRDNDRTYLFVQTLLSSPRNVTVWLATLHVPGMADALAMLLSSHRIRRERTKAAVGELCEKQGIITKLQRIVTQRVVYKGGKLVTCLPYIAYVEGAVAVLCHILRHSVPFLADSVVTHYKRFLDVCVREGADEYADLRLRHTGMVIIYILRYLTVKNLYLYVSMSEELEELPAHTLSKRNHEFLGLCAMATATTTNHLTPLGIAAIDEYEEKHMPAFLDIIHVLLTLLSTFSNRSGVHQYFILSLVASCLALINPIRQALERIAEGGDLEELRPDVYQIKLGEDVALPQFLAADLAEDATITAYNCNYFQVGEDAMLAMPLNIGLFYSQALARYTVGHVFEVMKLHPNSTLIQVAGGRIVMALLEFSISSYEIQPCDLQRLLTNICAAGKDVVVPEEYRDSNSFIISFRSIIRESIRLVSGAAYAILYDMRVTDVFGDDLALEIQDTESVPRTLEELQHFERHGVDIKYRGAYKYIARHKAFKSLCERVVPTTDLLRPQDLPQSWCASAFYDEDIENPNVLERYFEGV